MNKSTVRAVKRQFLARGKGYLRRSAVFCRNGLLGVKVNTLATVTDVENYFCRLSRNQGRYRRFARPQTEFFIHTAVSVSAPLYFIGKIFEEHRKT